MARTGNDRDHRLTSLLLAHKNEPTDYIAERVAPRVPSNDKGQYQKIVPGTFFQKRRTKLAYGAKADELVTSGSLEDFSMVYHGIDAPVDLAENKDFVMDRRTGMVDDENMHTLLYQAMVAAEETVMLNYEEEVRDIVYASTSYEAANRTALGNADKFDADDSNPIETIKEAMLTPLGKPNIGVCGPKVYTALAANANINRAAHKNDGKAGFQDTGTLAMLLGLQAVIVGEAWGGTEDIEDAPDARIWDSQDSFALIRVKRPMSLTMHNGSAFMVTASDRGGRFTRKWFEESRGPLGSQVCRPVDHRKVLHLSTISGHLLTGCLT